ncbi:uncharacterized protein FOMMEDRAFT_156759 [Fomitiporia mediterranea MF3/22]|uniref:uncharacterized protein n=1 Tax=Fomitiporia mediterranea (strain MF3/22) TaxID=694068 RepID=UPI0004409398|nr:uncharacterized protein FOMMEDRAFT_156759 [Fomitiporia mediterranea MF3/22]EJD03353.1 hypothetical protein FOMMEDRAFT_156759 [Fomitiporia mediterranea MF3/22]
MTNQTLDYTFMRLFHARSDTAVDADPSSVAFYVSEIVTTGYFDVGLLTILVYYAHVLQIRVMALYHPNKTLSIFLKILLAAEACLEFGILIYGNLFQNVVVVSLAEGVTFCGESTETPEILEIISWIVPLTYGAILLCLALFKSAEYWRMSSGSKGFHLITVLINDQMLYFAFVIFCCTLNIVEITIFVSNTFASNLLAAAGSPALLCLLGGYLLINLKEAGQLGVNGGTTDRSKVISDIEFAGGAPIAASTDSEE